MKHESNSIFECIKPQLKMPIGNKALRTSILLTFQERNDRYEILLVTFFFSSSFRSSFSYQFEQYL